MNFNKKIEKLILTMSKLIHKFQLASEQHTEVPKAFNITIPEAWQLSSYLLRDKKSACTTGIQGIS